MSQINIKNIYYMFAYAYKILQHTEYKNIELEEFGNVHDLLATILIKGISIQIKRGLHRDYIPQTETLGSLRGKIDINNSIKQQTMVTKKMVCHYDIFIEDSNLNQILKSSMMLLLRYGDIISANKKNLRKILLYFNNVTDINPKHINWNTVKFNRNNATYKLLINICWMIIRGLLLTKDEGKYKMSQHLDKQKMHRLYEKFILEYYRQEFPEIASNASFIDWNIADDGNTKFLPAMKSDVTLTYGSKTLIIDAKYYGNTMQYNPLFSSTSIISQNLYQIYAYVKNKDVGNTGMVSGLILYAKTDEEITPNCEYNLGGNLISVKTLDLSGSWIEIKSQLDNIASSLIM